MKYRVWHRTTYSYDDDVSNSYGIAYVTPRALPNQSVESTQLVVSPDPSDLHRDIDAYGNFTTFYQVTQRHQKLEVYAESIVDVNKPSYDPVVLGSAWETNRPAERADAENSWAAIDFLLPSRLVETGNDTRAFSYAQESLQPGRPIAEAVTDLMHRIYSDFTYKKGATSVTSTIDDLFESRAGVCQDFAHLAIAGLRSHGLAARYVSGYLATQPPPGKERIVGADATHAWPAVWLADDTWLAFDPTNDQWVNDRYVTVAWGRDYKDVPPVKGIIFTEAKKSKLKVAVDVAPVG